MVNPAQYGAQQPMQPQPAYGAPPPAYGGYGVPPMGMQPVPGAMMPQPDVKWSGLSTGGAFKIPVVCFIGRLTEVLKDGSSQYGLRIIEKYDQDQILESPVPWPWATVDVSIKYSDRESSGWGYHVESAKALGLALNATTLDEAMGELVGRIFELRQSEQSYGEDKQTGQAMKGDVWRFTRVVQPGQVQSFPQPQYAVPQPTPATAPVAGQFAAPVPVIQPVATAPAPAPVPVIQPSPVAAAPVAPTATQFDCTLAPTDTSAIRAKKLLNARALNEWLGVALVDDVVKADPAFINTIYDQSFIVGLKAAGQIVQGQDGKFAVVG